MTVELLTLIALWCGSPIDGHSYQVDTSYIGPVVSVQNVNQCRKKLVDCIHKTSGDMKCFDQQPYPGQDQR
jgi:hypothetical protein